MNAMSEDLQTDENLSEGAKKLLGSLKVAPAWRDVCKAFENKRMCKRHPGRRSTRNAMSTEPEKQTTSDTLNAWAREHATTYSAEGWRVAERVAKETSIRLFVLQCRALLGRRDEVAEGLNQTERMVLRASPGLSLAQPGLVESGLVAADDDGLAYFTPFGLAVARSLEAAPQT